MAQEKNFCVVRTEVSLQYYGNGSTTSVNVYGPFTKEEAETRANEWQKKVHLASSGAVVFKVQRIWGSTAQG